MAPGYWLLVPGRWLRLGDSSELVAGRSRASSLQREASGQKVELEFLDGGTDSG